MARYIRKSHTGYHKAGKEAPDHNATHVLLTLDEYNALKDELQLFKFRYSQVQIKNTQLQWKLGKHKKAGNDRNESR